MRNFIRNLLIVLTAVVSFSTFSKADGSSISNAMKKIENLFGKKTIRIMPYGDSLTAGGFVINDVFNIGEGYRYSLWKSLEDSGHPTHFVGSIQDGPKDFAERSHEGHSGRRIDEITVDEHQWVAEAKPDIVLLLVGTNDCIQNYDMANAVSRLESLIEKIQTDAPQAHVFVSTTIPNSDFEINNRVISYNQGLTKMVIAKSRVDSRIHFVDMFTDAHLSNGLGGNPSDLIDGTHPTPDGYERMAGVWFQALASVTR